jgi:hypothetical protein
MESRPHRRFESSDSWCCSEADDEDSGTRDLPCVSDALVLQCSQRDTGYGRRLRRDRGHRGDWVRGDRWSSRRGVIQRLVLHARRLHPRPSQWAVRLQELSIYVPRIPTVGVLPAFRWRNGGCRSLSRQRALRQMQHLVPSKPARMHRWQLRTARTVAVKERRRGGFGAVPGELLRGVWGWRKSCCEHRSSGSRGRVSGAIVSQCNAPMRHYHRRNSLRLQRKSRGPRCRRIVGQCRDRKCRVVLE